MAPAAIAKGIFNPIATPIIAIPIVPIDPHDVPVQTEIRAPRKNAEI